MNWLLSVLCSILVTLPFPQTAQSLPFPTYSYRQHPVYDGKYHGSIQPVVMDNYLRYIGGYGWTTSRMFFAPGAASYNIYNTTNEFLPSLDALYIPRRPIKSRTPYVKVTLNHKARVFLVMKVGGVALHKIGSNTHIRGLPKSWKNPRAIRSSTGKAINMGDFDRLGRNVKLPSQAVVVEKLVDAGKPLFLPHPRSVSVHGLECARFTLLFAQPKAGSAKRFAYPSVPATVWDKVRGKHVQTTPVLPNSRCPTWLHDLHLTPTRDADVARRQGERLFWRTWHPMIDPVWWCYYDHEHGTYPGHYRPMFHQTAFKTPDTTTGHGRQEESHNGFKVFSFSLDVQQKFVVIVVHMHLSRARRFTARHHTIIFAVLDSEWKLEAELQMKADFGAAVVTLRDRSELPISSTDASIIRELDREHVFARRRFNVLNIDKNYPTSVQKRYVYNSFLTPTESNKASILDGIYEQWRASLKTCLKPKTRFVNRGMNFDVRKPSTAMRMINATSDDSMQKLAGDNVNRFLKFRDSLVFSKTLCEFKNTEKGNTPTGVFYTDPYFTKVEKRDSAHTVRQFLSPTLGLVELRSGLLLPVGPWSQPLSYVPKGTKKVDGRRLENIENSVIRSVN